MTSLSPRTMLFSWTFLFASISGAWQQVASFSSLIPTKSPGWEFSHAMQPMGPKPVNAWEEGAEVVLTCCQKDHINLYPVLEFNAEKAFGIGSKLYEYRMNLKTGEVKHKQLSNLWADFPRINPEYGGRKVRYAYCAIYDEQDKIKGVAKYDLSMEPSPTMSKQEASGNMAALFHYGPGREGGEAVFVPRTPGMDGQEDDGYLISFVYDVKTAKVKTSEQAHDLRKSEVVVIEVKTMEPEPVAVVRLPRRVPHGFHAHVVSQEQLRQQA